MKNSLIRTINSEMNSYLNNYQLEKLNEILEYNLYNYDVIEIEENKKELENYTELFIASKKVEGCSDRTLNYYQTTIDNMLEAINKNIKTVGRFYNSEDAFICYKEAKEKYIKEVADEYKDKIPQKLYEALYN